MKKTLLIAAAISASVFAAGAMAAGTLTLQSKNETNMITVKCGPSQASEKPTMFPIKPSAPTVLPYSLIKMFMGSDLFCDFFENNTDIGTAHITISGDASTATVLSWQNADPTSFDVALSAPDNVATPDLSVTLTKK